MKKLTLLLPTVDECSIAECAYNAAGDCHANAITVGDGVHPGCDTYLPHKRHTAAGHEAGVGACKVDACQHNRDFSCGADAIRVGRHGGSVECLTFEARA